MLKRNKSDILDHYITAYGVYLFLKIYFLNSILRFYTPTILEHITKENKY